MSNKHTATSQYRLIASTLRERIENGTYARGSTLPIEPKLAEELGVDRSVVNRALAVLANEGLVYVHRGVGTKVTEIPPILRNATARYIKAARERDGARGAFDAEIRALGFIPRSDVEVYRAQPPAVVAEEFGSEDEVVVRARQMYASEHPVQMANSYIPADIAAGTAIEQVDSGPGGIISRFAELGFRQTRMRERASVRPPTDEEIEFLKLRPDHRVMQIVHTGFAGDRPVEVCVHILPAHFWIGEWEWEIPEG